MSLLLLAASSQISCELSAPRNIFVIEICLQQWKLHCLWWADPSLQIIARNSFPIFMKVNRPWTIISIPLGQLMRANVAQMYLLWASGQFYQFHVPLEIMTKHSKLGHHFQLISFTITAVGLLVKLWCRSKHCSRNADVDVAITNRPLAGYIDTGDDIDMEVQMYSVDFKVKYFNSIALFYTMLRGKYLVPVSTISEIVGELSVTHELEYEFLKN